MKLIGNIQITKSKQGEVWSNVTGEWVNYTGTSFENQLLYAKRVYRSKYYTNEQRLKILSKVKDDILDVSITPIDNTITAELDKAQLTNTLNNFINFFSEFSFEPNFRFVNTFAKFCQTNIDNAKDYIRNYFALTDNAYALSINEKINSYEFEQITNTFSKMSSTKTINKRFKLYYGSQGTGKTTKALEESNNNCMVCHSAMLPSDLMEDFKFEDGKAMFTPSALQNAMTNGTVIVLDEINLLPFESLRFLQSILDNKTEILYKGQTISIKDGFKIIGTMNLQVNGTTYALPEPLVDRAEELKQFKLTADSLIDAIL